jgi:two-component system C4-dicarboxylate transport sensor histidine kinase DctB
MSRLFAGRIPWLVFLAVSFTALAVAAILVGDWAREQALESAARDARGEAALRAAVLEAELDKHRSVPVVLASDPDVLTAVETRSPARLAVLDSKLELLTARTHASAIYVIAADGLTVAAGNSRTPRSFVGERYGFRPYFRQAMARGASEYFALGTVSNLPGLYLARRLEGPSGPVGVVVVKMEFNGLEAAWARLSDPAFVTEGHGVVLISSEPNWRFRTLANLPHEEREQLRQTLQFGGSPLDPLPLQPTGRGLLLRNDVVGYPRYVAGQTSVDGGDWTLHVLIPAGPTVEAAASSARALTALGGLAIAGLAAAGLFLAGRAERRARRQAEARAELEARVDARTAELSDANSRLQAEMDERRRNAIELQRLQEELGQSNRLAALGQIVAGVAHEINQPLAAIRAYADNAGKFLEREKPESARQNLDLIAGLTERIGLITADLKGLARKQKVDLETVDLGTAVDGALALMGHRPRRQGVSIVHQGPREVAVLGDRRRIEQVLVNLIQNALDALEGRPGGALTVQLEADAAYGRVVVSDNGPGLTPEAERALFTPFATTKAQGLGLGLVISRDIARELGGALEGGSNPEGGARFVFSLRRAP